jgi:site-specific DNA-methyltransferase (adenine-specific)
MITPSRWMTRSTEGIPEDWIDFMLNDNRIRIMHDFTDASLCFPGVEIKGGVNYFLWDRDNYGKCHYYLHTAKDNAVENVDYLNASNTGIVIRDITALSIINNIKLIEGNYIETESLNFSFLVSPKDYFTNKQNLTSSWTGYSKIKTEKYSIKYYLNKNIHKIDFGWVSKQDVPKNIRASGLNKVYIPAAGGSGFDSQVLGYPFYGESNSVCSQTYLVIGYDPDKHNFTKQECENIVTYIKTRFFRYLVSIKKKTQNGPRGVYQFVPLQDFSKPWTDEELYAKYGLTQEEIDFIESRIRPME